MSAKSVVPRERARRDVEAALDHDLAEAGQKAAEGFVAALERAYRHIACHPWARHPGTGSPRLAHELGLQGLRSWHLRRYPNLVFHVEHADHLDVWRVLHAQRDLPAWLRAEERQP